MADLVFNNGSIKIGYNGTPWTFRNTIDDVFMHTSEPTTRPIGSFRTEAIRAAREIRKTFPGKTLYVLYSGGIDSEVVLEAFRLADIPVTVVISEFENKANDHDMVYAKAYLKRTNFTGRVLTYPVNMQSWLGSEECLNWAKETQTTGLVFTHLFRIMQAHLRDGIVITGVEEPSLWIKEGTGWVWNRNELHFCLHKYFMKEGLSGVPSFFQWSTELMAAFIYNKHYVPAYEGLYNPSIWDAEFLKYGFYWDQFKLHQRAKYTGYEHVTSELITASEDWVDSLLFKWEAEIDYKLTDWHRDMNVIRALA